MEGSTIVSSEALGFISLEELRLISIAITEADLGMLF
jgi:hypothetical protein